MGKKTIGERGDEPGGEESYFRERVADLRTAMAEANAVSKAVGDRFVSERVGWAQWLHLKLCILADSMSVLCDAETRIARGDICTLDQTALMSLARSMVETSVMLAYVADPAATDQEWRLRRQVICLNDAQTRYRMFKGFGPDSEDEAKGLRQAMMDQRAVVEADPAFAGLPEQRREKLLSGSEPYVDGLRAAARLAGWEVEEFNAVYAYMSSHAHGGPVSFIRTDEHGFDFGKPTGAQYAVAGFALEQAAGALKFATAATRRNFLDVFMGRG